MCCSADATEEAPSTTGVPVFCMMPLDTVNSDGVYRHATSKWFNRALASLACSGVRGVAVDVWWGAVEREPRVYDFGGYRALLEVLKRMGLKLQAVMSFHACGANVGDSAQVPLPAWVLKCGESDPDLFFADRPREGRGCQRNREYVSFFADEEPALRGRTPLQCYADFMTAFRNEFAADLGATIEEVVVGTGPCGELRYPSYVETQGWRFPGIGEFQCYDRRARASLAQSAAAAGHPEWGFSGPHDAGCYTSVPEETGFFRSWGGSWDSDYGRFFLGWYSGHLEAHGNRVVAAAAEIFRAYHQPQSPKQQQPPRGSGGAQSSGNSPAGNGAGVQPSLGQPGVSGQAASATANANIAVGSKVTVLLNGSGNVSAGQAAVGLSKALHKADLTGSSLRNASRVSTLSAASSCAAASGPDEPISAASSRFGGSSHGSSAAQDMSYLGHGMGSIEMIDATDEGVTPRASSSGEPSPWGSAGKSSSGSLLSDATAFQEGGTASPSGPQERWQSAAGTGTSAQPGFPAAGGSQPNETSASAPVSGQSSGPPRLELSIKLAGLHWYYRTRSHAAELTAGYYNSEGRNGYEGLVGLCARHGVSVTLTCVEMCDSQHPPEACCGPEGLLRQVRETAATAGVILAGENALPVFSPHGVDSFALERIVYNTRAWAPPLQQQPQGQRYSATDGSAVSVRAASAPSDSSGREDFTQDPRYADQQLPQTTLLPLRSFTFLRLSPEMTSPAHQGAWMRFMYRMQSSGSDEPSMLPEPHLGLRPWAPPPPPPKPHFRRQQSAPVGQDMERSKAATPVPGCNSTGNLNAFG